MVSVAGERPIMADVGITSPYREGILESAAAAAGFAAQDYASRKNAKYRAAGASYCHHVPVIHENSGRMCDEAWALLKKLSGFAAADRAITKEDWITMALGRLGIVNIRAIFRLVRAYTPVHARLAGGALVPGVPIPTDDVDALDAV